MFLAFCLLITSGCVSYGKRYIEVSPRYATLDKDFFARSTVADSTFTYHNYAVTDSDLSGTGFQASFVEVERKYLYSRLGFHYVNLKTDSFVYTVDGAPVVLGPTELTASGFEADIGFKLWHISPYLTAKYSRMKFQDHPEMDVLFPEKNFLFKDFISSIGGGLAIDIPITKWLSLFLNGRWMANSQTYSLGFLIGGWDFGDQKEYEKQQKSSRK